MRTFKNILSSTFSKNDNRSSAGSFQCSCPRAIRVYCFKSAQSSLFPPSVFPDGRHFFKYPSLSSLEVSCVPQRVILRSGVKIEFPGLFRPFFERSPNSGLGNIVCSLGDSIEDRFFDAYSNFFCTTPVSSLLQIMLPSLSFGCVLFLSKYPELCQLSLPELLNDLMSRYPFLDYGVFPDSTVPVTYLSDNIPACSSALVESSVSDTSPELNSSNGLAIIGTLILAVILAGVASHYMN